MTDSMIPMTDDPELHAYVDGRLDPLRQASVEARLAADPALARQVHAWKAQRLALRDLNLDVLERPVPAHLLEAAQMLQRRSSRFARWQQWGGMAAGIAFAFVAGWAGHMQWQDRAAAVAGARTGGQFVHQAVLAHSVYVPEVRHPVEVEAAQQQHLVQWLSKRLNRPLKLPSLAASGYELVGGRLLPGDSGARAQFMYQNAAGERVTLYVGAVDAAGGDKRTGETAFRFTDEAGVASFYWVENGFGYAISGKVPRPGLLVLAEAVYRQL